MCLAVDKEKTKNFWDTRGRKGKSWCWCYKVYKYRYGNLHSPLQGSYRRIYFGEIVSDRYSKVPFTDSCDTISGVCRGIHVIYQSKCLPDYKTSFKTWDDNPVIVRVKCYKKDFVAADLNEAVFMKVHLTQEGYRMAMRKAKKLYKE